MKFNKEIGLGFICSTYKSELSTNHSLKLKNLNKKNLLSVFQKNIVDLIKLLQLSNNLNCSIFRLGSQFIPFASHPKFNRSWLKEIKSIIKDYLPEIKKFEIRITMHPGQYVILSSENKNLIKRSLDELKYHFWVLDNLEQDENGIVVIHCGGTYGDKIKSLKNIIKNISQNKWLLERLALENDEKIYSVSDVMIVCQELLLPLVFDYFHHKLLTSDFNFLEVINTWKGRIPEFHLSSRSNKGNKFSHGDYILKSDFIEFINFLYTNIPFEKNLKIDILLEAKKKELALKKLLKSLKDEKYLLV
ncbi:MAG: UV DNA damage repair endonuclease UvsE [Patescibacteria group bacterium]|nr:UV DNA damage repair endonuclease UvsE [Patescibacteria group bacterium]